LERIGAERVGLEWSWAERGEEREGPAGKDLFGTEWIGVGWRREDQDGTESGRERRG